MGDQKEGVRATCERGWRCSPVDAKGGKVAWVREVAERTLRCREGLIPYYCVVNCH